MAMTHEDSNHSAPSFLQCLQERADAAEKAKASLIGGGAENEEELGRWKAVNGIHCRHMPPDPQGILRISVGGGDNLPVNVNYVTVRGPIGQCIQLLEKAIAALRECPE